MVRVERPLRRRGEAVDRAVIAATLTELGERGAEAATVAAIAARAGVHETTVYRRFGTRTDLFLAALLERSDATVPVPDTGSLRGDLLAIMRSLCEIYSSALGVAMLRTSVLGLSTQLGSGRTVFWEHRIDRLRSVFERATERGELAAGVDPALALEMLVAPVHARLTVTGFPLADDLPERVVDLLLAGLVPRS